MQKRVRLSLFAYQKSNRGQSCTQRRHRSGLGHGNANRPIVDLHDRRQTPRARYIDIRLDAASNHTLAISDDWPRQCVAPGLARYPARLVRPRMSTRKAAIE